MEKSLESFFSEFLDETLGFFREFFRERYVDFDEKVPSFSRSDRHPLPFYAKEFAVGNAGRDGDRKVTVERGERVALAEDGIGDLHIEISGNTAGNRFPDAGEADHLAVLDTGGNHDLDFFLFSVSALPGAGRTLLFRHFATAAALAARLDAGECSEKRALALVDAPGAVAERAGDRLGARCAAGTAAGVAERHLRQKHPAIRSENGFAETDLDIDGYVATARGSAAAAAEHLAEDIAEIEAHVLKIKAFEAGSSLTSPLRSSARSVGEYASVRVVFRTLFFVGKDAVRLAYLLELRLIPVLLVGVILVSEFPERFLHFIGICSALDTANLGIIFF